MPSRKVWYRRNPCLTAGGRPKQRFKRYPVDEAMTGKDAYQCPLCGYWHIGHPTGSRKEAS